MCRLSKTNVQVEQNCVVRRHTMGWSVRKQPNRHRYLTVLLMLLSIAGLISPAVKAQQASANINGVVKDPTGAAIANARVQLTNVNTAVVKTTTTNTDGVYVFLNIVPGTYTMRASAPGFNTVTQPETTLEVNQTATFDFSLKVGATQDTVSVQAISATVETSTSELGTVVSPNEVADLPLNGRNFTQLLTITAGVANVNRDQSSGGGSGWAGNSIGSFSFPAVNGARNRSNLFLLDGINDLNTMLGMYNYSPIIDDIEEFKTQGHNDLAEYGGVAGGIVSVVTKSGTNEYHGTVWEFLRNEQMDARGYFELSRTPLRQNQYGAAGGGPLSIPKLYTGRNKSFVFASCAGNRSARTDGCGAQWRFQRVARLAQANRHLRSRYDGLHSRRSLHAPTIPGQHNPQRHQRRQSDQSDLGPVPGDHPKIRCVG